MNYCIKHNDLCEYAGAFGCNALACRKYEKLTDTYEHEHTSDIDINGTINKNLSMSLEYISEELAKQNNVQNAIDLLEKFGIQVKTEYGYYRSLYDVLVDIGKAMEKL